VSQQTRLVQQLLERHSDVIRPFIVCPLFRTSTQQGLARRQLQLGMGSDDLGQALPGWSPGLQLENQQGRLGFRAQGSWSLSRVSSSDVPLSLGEERGGFYSDENGGWPVSPALRRRGRSEIKHRAQGTTQHSIIVTSGSVGLAAPGAAKRCAKSFSSSTLCSGQAHSRASQGGSCNWEWGQMLCSSTAGMELAGSNLKTSRDRLRLPAQGGWSLSRVSSSGIAALSG
jgi:hypothetical protein